MVNENTITVRNKGLKSINVGFFKNLDDFQPSFQAKRTIQISPGASNTVTLPRGWEGRVQKLSGAPADPATRAEIRYDTPFMGLTFCDVSLIRGFNGAMEFSAQDGSLKTGFTNDLYPKAPNQFKTQDSGKNNVLQPTQPFTGGTNNELVAYYRIKVSKGNGYILPDDHDSSHGTSYKRINLDIY